MNDTTPRDRISRITRLLIPVSWTLWGILLLILLWAFVDSIANPVYTPEVSPQVGPMVMAALLIVFVGFGLLLRWAARRRSTGCLIVLTLMLAYVFFMLIAILVFEAWNDWQTEMGTTFTLPHVLICRVDLGQRTTLYRCQEKLCVPGFRNLEC